VAWCKAEVAASCRVVEVVMILRTTIFMAGSVNEVYITFYGIVNKSIHKHSDINILAQNSKKDNQ
jgi:hypothetical protein